MTKRVLFGTIISIAILTVGVLLFIHFTNDHAECETIVENTIGRNGESISTTKHICNETFNI